MPCCRACAGNSFTYQITLASTDLLLHSSFDPKGKTSPLDVFRSQFNEFMVGCLDARG